MKLVLEKKVKHSFFSGEEVNEICVKVFKMFFGSQSHFCFFFFLISLLLIICSTSEFLLFPPRTVKITSSAGLCERTRQASKSQQPFYGFGAVHLLQLMMWCVFLQRTLYIWSLCRINIVFGVFKFNMTESALIMTCSEINDTIFFISV